MSELKPVPMPEDAWESGELGRDEQFVAVAPSEFKREIEEALELQMISIRLQKELITELKFIAESRGIGYQPLIRTVLARFARAEVRQIAQELQETEKAREKLGRSGCQTA